MPLGATAARTAAFSARSPRAASHSATKPAGTAASGTAPDAHRSSSPSTCLQGIFRLGQEHVYAGPSRSTATWYGFLPLPAARPQTACAVAPSPDQAPVCASLRPAASDPASGASPSTCDASQAAPTVRT